MSDRLAQGGWPEKMIRLVAGKARKGDVPHLGRREEAPSLVLV